MNTVLTSLDSESLLEFLIKNNTLNGLVDISQLQVKLNFKKYTYLIELHKELNGSESNTIILNSDYDNDNPIYRYKNERFHLCDTKLILENGGLEKLEWVKSHNWGAKTWFWKKCNSTTSIDVDNLKIIRNVELFNNSFKIFLDLDLDCDMKCLEMPCDVVITLGGDINSDKNHSFKLSPDSASVIRCSVEDKECLGSYRLSLRPYRSSLSISIPKFSKNLPDFLQLILELDYTPAVVGIEITLMDIIECLGDKVKEYLLNDKPIEDFYAHLIEVAKIDLNKHFFGKLKLDENKKHLFIINNVMVFCVPEEVFTNPLMVDNEDLECSLYGLIEGNSLEDKFYDLIKDY